MGSRSSTPSATAAGSASSFASRCSDYGFVGIKVHRHDARITREVCEVARAFGLPVLYDVMGETVGRRAPGAGIPRCRLHHPASRELRRRLARAARLDRSPRAPSQRLRRHGGRPSLRSPRAGGATRRRAQRSCSVPMAPGCTRRSSSRKYARWSCPPDGRSAGRRWQLPAPHLESPAQSAARRAAAGCRVVRSGP